MAGAGAELAAAKAVKAEVAWGKTLVTLIVGLPRWAYAAAAAAAVLVLATELKRRANLVATGEKCMDTGSDDACLAYDEGVEATPAWKLRLALPKLPTSNVLADKLAGPAPSGFTWGKTF